MLNWFPVEIGLLVQLRYLAVKGNINEVPTSIGNVLKLEMFLLEGSRRKVLLPRSFWRVATLRHVFVDGHFSETEDGDSFILRNLITISTLVLSFKSEPILRRNAANICKLSCIFELSQDYSWQSNGFPSLNFHRNLETMNIFSMRGIHRNFPFEFPSNLRSLTLSGFSLPGNEISAIGRLRRLVDLKLLSRSSEGDTWDMTKCDFCSLKFLKLDGLEFRRWNASKHRFPTLQRQVLRDCKLLLEDPSSFVYLPKLKMIVVKSCTRYVAESVLKIREAQQRAGNKEFRSLPEMIGIAAHLLSSSCSNLLDFVWRKQNFKSLVFCISSASEKAFWHCN